MRHGHVADLLGRRHVANAEEPGLSGVCGRLWMFRVCRVAEVWLELWRRPRCMKLIPLGVAAAGRVVRRCSRLYNCIFTVESCDYPVLVA
jgi:hypothetical protein